MEKRDLCPQVLQRVSQEEWFQADWRAAAEIEDRFNQVRELLNEQQQEVLDAYLAAREELALGMVAAAYDMGRSAGK